MRSSKSYREIWWTRCRREKKSHPLVLCHHHSFIEIKWMMTYLTGCHTLWVFHVSKKCFWVIEQKRKVRYWSQAVILRSLHCVNHLPGKLCNA
ncbi:hypothetical protein Celaphus_00017538, partial [Cervus elaphus hippelaphus]